MRRRGTTTLAILACAGATAGCGGGGGSQSQVVRTVTVQAPATATVPPHRPNPTTVHGVPVAAIQAVKAWLSSKGLPAGAGKIHMTSSEGGWGVCVDDSSGTFLNEGGGGGSETGAQTQVNKQGGTWVVSNGYSHTDCSDSSYFGPVVATGP